MSLKTASLIICSNIVFLKHPQVVANPDEIVDPVRPVWGTKWTLPLAYEILIGKKTDPACFQTFPGADSVSVVVTSG